MAILFDTLKIRNRLAQKGMDEAVAEALAELLNEAQIADLATRRDKAKGIKQINAEPSKLWKARATINLNASKAREEEDPLTGKRVGDLELCLLAPDKGALCEDHTHIRRVERRHGGGRDRCGHGL